MSYELQLFLKFRKLLFAILTLLFTSLQASQKEAIVNPLEPFFRFLLINTNAGHVLYGEKPIYLCSFLDPCEKLPGTKEHEEIILFLKGLDSWKSLNIHSSDK